MKRIKYNEFFNNGFTSHSRTYIKWFPFWWSNEKIVEYLKKQTANHTSLCWVQLFNKEIWCHPSFK